MNRYWQRTMNLQQYSYKIYIIVPYKRPFLISWSYLKRTWRSESPGPDVLTTTAAALEPLGIEDGIKKLFLPWRSIELRSVNADGDAKASNNIIKLEIIVIVKDLIKCWIQI